MIAVRCNKCGKLLGFYDGKGEVKCPRSGCGQKTVFDTDKMKGESKTGKGHTDLRYRKTSSGITHW